jgi:hypothetical protein
MTDGTVIILDNSGDDSYRQSSREYLTNPIRTDRIKILLTNTAQLDNLFKIRNFKSFGSESNRDISLKQFISALDKTNLIIDIKLDPPIILDGQTYFQTDIEPNSEIDLVFEFDQVEMADYLK